MKTSTMNELKRFEIPGGYNDPLPMMKETNEAGIRVLFTYGADAIGYRQIDPAKLKAIGIHSKYFMSIHYFLVNTLDKSGVAMSYDGDTERIRYFTWKTCEHEFRVPDHEDFARGVSRPSMCYHVDICTKCGYVREIDSSG